MAKLADFGVVLLDDWQTVVPDGYAGYGYYLIDDSKRIYAGPFRSKEAANAYLEELWDERRTG